MYRFIKLFSPLIILSSNNQNPLRALKAPLVTYQKFYNYLAKFKIIYGYFLCEYILDFVGFVVFV
jgi:hypothetical protein